MLPEARFNWLEGRILGEGKAGVDILDSKFVDDYIDATGAPYRFTNFGAYKCAQLGRDLSTMYRNGRLNRVKIGVEGMAGMGFPRWVFSYSIPPHHARVMQQRETKEADNG